MKRILTLAICTLMIIFTLCSCGVDTADNGKINVVCTVFAPYDFVRQIAGDKVNLRMLLSPGSEAHDYDPRPNDITDIQKANLFIMIGGESEEWASRLTEEHIISETNIVRLIDRIDTVEEEHTDGMQETGGHHHEAETDEHVWTSPENAITMVQTICDALCRADSENSAVYRANAKDYIAELEKLGSDMKQISENSKHKEIIVADRFPFRYLTDYMNIKYFAAFPGCAAQTEPAPSTVAFLIDKTRNDNIPVVFGVDYSRHKIADAVCDETGANVRTLYSCHNVSKKQFDSGETYIGLMRHNEKVLREALN